MMVSLDRWFYKRGIPRIDSKGQSDIIEPGADAGRARSGIFPQVLHAPFCWQHKMILARISEPLISLHFQNERVATVGIMR